MNIQFGKNKNNTNKVKKIYNQGTIITARPQTSKYPYKILSISEFPKPTCNCVKKVQNLKNKKNILSSKNIMRKSFSYVEESKKVYAKHKEIKNNNYFNQSTSENNKILFTNNPNFDFHGDYKKKRVFSAKQRKSNLSAINNESNNEILIQKNRKTPIKKEIRNNNKKKVSNYRMNKYIENFIDKRILDVNKKPIVSYVTNQNINSNIYNKMNNDDNSKIIHFLSEVINTENLHNNINYNTTNNIYRGFNKNKNKNFTRNLIIKKYYNNNKHKVSLSYTKNTINGLKPLVINFKENLKIFNYKKESNKINNNNFLHYKNKYGSEIKLKKNKSSKIQIINHKTENNITLSRPIRIKINKKTKKNNYFENEEIKNNIINKNNFTDKNKIKNKYKRKFKFNKDIKFKSKKKKSYKNHEINGFLKYVNNIKNEKFNFIYNSNNQKGCKYKKNGDIYDYIVSPKNSNRIIDETNKNDYNDENKSITQ